MKTKQQEQRAIKKIESTKNYDDVSNKIRKLLKATAETYLPELCEALRKDWYPTLSEKAIQSNKYLRDDIRKKIFDDWSKDRPFAHSKDNIWNDETISIFIPDWLKNPSENLKTSATENLIKARQAKILKSVRISERQKQKLNELADELPDEIIEEEQKEESSLTPEKMHKLGLAPFGQTGKSIRQLKGAIFEPAYKLFAALANNTSPPTSRSDLILDYIKPSREFFKGLMLELDRSERTDIYNILQCLSAIIEDRIEIIDKIDEKERQ